MKKKFIAGMLAMSIMFMGAGYAAWTQNFTVTNTVNTGNLEFNAQLVEDGGSPQYGSIEVTDRKAAADDSEMKLTFKDVYPGSTYSYAIKIDEKSTMGIKYKLNSDIKEHAVQTYSVMGVNEEWTLAQLNEELAKVYVEGSTLYPSSQKGFTIVVKTTFNKDGDNVIAENISDATYENVLSFTASQFNAE